MNWISVVISFVTGFFKNSDGNTNYTNIISSIFSVIALFIILYLNDKVTDLKVELAQCESNVKIMQIIIDEQNEAIENSRANAAIIGQELTKLSSALDNRYSEIMIKEGHEFRQATCDEKLEFLVGSFENFKSYMIKELEGERR